MGVLIMGIFPATECAELALGRAVLSQPSETVVGVYLYPGPAVAALQFDLLFDPEALTAGEVLAGDNIAAAGKSLAHNEVDAGRLRVLISGFNQNSIAAGPVCTIAFDVGALTEGVYALTLDQAVLSSPSGDSVTVFTGNGGIVLGANPFHTADADLDFAFSAHELDRVIALYTAKAHHCTAGTHDGFAPGTGSSGCAPHHSDYAGGANWRVDFPEMIRLVQFYNLGGYRKNAATEDGFSADPPVAPPLAGKGARQP